MPFVRFAAPTAFPFSAPADPLVDFLAAALASETPAQCQPKSKPAATLQRAPQCAPRRRIVKRYINPNFDVSEREHEYVLEGELPGVSDKSSITVDFEDAQTIVIKGEISRTAKNATKASEPEQPQQQLTEAALQASAAAQEPVKTTTTAEGETVVYDDAASTTSSGKRKSYQVTVEDEVDESETGSNASYEVVDGPTKADKGKAPVRKSEDVEMANSEPAAKPAQPENGSSVEKKEETAQRPTVKYWISERPIGVFERKFKFQGLIDQDNVKATLENGLLTVVVPKREAYVRQVFIY